MTSGARVSSLGPVVTLIENYCIDCHNSADDESNLNLEDFDASAIATNITTDTAVWEKIAKRLRARQMPPADYVSRPSEDEFTTSLAALESVLDDHAQAHPNPGRTDSIRRLNRTEYKNAIRDLLALDVDVDDLLPADPLGHGFDNVTVGDLSPVLLNRYITAGQHISRLAVGGQQRSPGGTTVRLPADRTQENHVPGLPLGTRGGTLLEQNFAIAGEYEIQIRLMRDRDENLEGLTQPHDIDILVDRELVHRFTVTPPKAKVGWQKDDTLVDANLKKRFHVTAGPHQIGVTFPVKFLSLLENRRQPFDASFNRHRHPRRTPALYEVSIVGPFDPQGPGDTPSRRRIFSCRPDGDNRAAAVDCATRILRRLMRQAYRRGVTEGDLEVPLRFFTQRFAADGFEPAIETAIAAVLVNPHFLFRAEMDPADIVPGDAYLISDIELASRLSFFLWSSIPDEELLSLAEENRLRDEGVLTAQVTRMLDDERSRSLVDNFAAQWLYLRNLDTFRPDMRRYADFDDNLREAMRGETESLFEHVMRNNLSVLKLIDSDTAFLNERLATHYGIPHVVGSHFRPIELSDNDFHRGGLLRHGSILAVTSYATRTSPTIRGNWILENILGTPAPPQPPNVPGLTENTSTEKLTLRERLAEHRENPSCASCHNLMDPVGFALENYDAVGRWRLFEDGQAIDSSGALPDGQEIDSVAQLEAGIMKRPDLFVATLTEKMLTFALGRGVDADDYPAIRKIVGDASTDDFRFRAIVVGIVKSTPFQMRLAK
ncbi:MAG: DUF1592 domain-containing protein [Pirellulaceae bacterium]|nr:DUF1592 domain-containing protein [Pirellulaceae bacterium]